MNIRVLLVDAHDEARGTLARRLQRDQRLEIAAQVATVQEASAVVEKANPDLMLLDVQSHDDAAAADCQELGSLTEAPLIVLASFMTGEHWRTLRSAGAADYLLKHADGERLCNALVRLAERYRTTSMRL